MSQFDRLVRIACKYSDRPELLRLVLVGTELFEQKTTTKELFIEGLNATRKRFAGMLETPPDFYADRVDLIAFLERAVGNGAHYHRLLNSFVSSLRSPSSIQVSANRSAQAQAISELLIPQFISPAEVVQASLFQVPELEPLLQNLQFPQLRMLEAAKHDREFPKVLSRIRSVGANTIFQKLLELPLQKAQTAFEGLVSRANQKGWEVSLTEACTLLMDARRRRDIELLELSIVSRLPVFEIREIVTGVEHAEV